MFTVAVTENVRESPHSSICKSCVLKYEDCSIEIIRQGNLCRRMITIIKGNIW